MPLSSEQRLRLLSLIGTHTIYTIPAGHDWLGTYVVDSIESILDSSRHRARDLCIPNGFIRGRDPAQFWYSMASVASGANAFDWHEIDFEVDNRDEAVGNKRYVYTWTLGDATIKFYTKTFHFGRISYLRWYVRRFAADWADVDSGVDTDSENEVQ
jgi:hypothetical protein